MYHRNVVKYRVGTTGVRTHNIVVPIQNNNITMVMPDGESLADLYGY